VGSSRAARSVVAALSLATVFDKAVVCGVSTVSTFKSQISFKWCRGELAHIENSSHRSLRWDHKLLRQSPYHIGRRLSGVRWHGDWA
jgi:hypothetical protein